MAIMEVVAVRQAAPVAAPSTPSERSRERTPLEVAGVILKPVS